MIPRILILLGLVALLKKTGNVALCAGIYAAVLFVFGLIINGNFLGALLAAMIGGVLSFIYFWLLQKTEETFAWWIVLIVGFLIGAA